MSLVQLLAHAYSTPFPTKIKGRVAGGKTPIFVICSKYVDFFMGCKMVSYSSDCGQVADSV